MADRCPERDRAFTLIEVTLAILILAGALSVFVGLQTSAINMTIAARKQQQAMLLARRILTAIEYQQESLTSLRKDPGHQKARGAVAVLEEFVDLDPEEKKDLQQRLADFFVELDVVDIALPSVSMDQKGQLEEQALKHILLRVFWGEAADQYFEVLYFVPGRPEGGDTGEDDGEEIP